MRWLIFLLVLAAPGAMAQRADLPKPVADAVAGLGATCRDSGGKPLPPAPELVQSADIDGDGKLDYILYTGAFACRDVGNLFGGSGGSDMDVFLSSRGYRTGQDTSFFGYQPSIDRSQRPARILMPKKVGVTATYGWNGRALVDMGARPTGRADGPRPAPPVRPAAQPWEVGRMPDGVVYAHSQPVGPVQGVMALCLGRGYRAALWMPQASGSGPIAVDFVGQASTLSYRMQDQTQGIWAIELRDPALLALLTGGEASVGLRVNGRELGRVPLAGADGAIRKALAGCAKVLPPPVAHPPVTAVPLPPAEPEWVAPPTAPGHVAGYPHAVDALIADLSKGCASAGGKLKLEVGSVLLGDLDGDSRIDHLVNESAISCKGAVSSPFCGTAGCGVTPFLTSRDSRMEQGFLAQSARIDQRFKPARIVMTGRDGQWVRVWNGRAFVAPPAR